METNEAKMRHNDIVRRKDNSEHHAHTNKLNALIAEKKNELKNSP